MIVEPGKKEDARGSLLPTLAAALVLVACAFILFKRHLDFASWRAGVPLSVPQDFNVYLTALGRVRKGVDPYIPSESLPYKYAPGVLVPFLLLPADPFRAWLAAKLFYVGSWALAVFLGAGVRRWSGVALLLLGIAISWKGMLEALDYGQIEPLFLVGAVVVASCLPSRAWIAGVVAGCLPWIKLPWAMIGVFGLVEAMRAGAPARNRFVLGAASSALALGIVVPGFLWGFPFTAFLLKRWLVSLGGQPAALFLDPFNQSLSVSVLRLFSRMGWHGAGIVSVAALLALAAALAWNAKRRATRAPALHRATPWLIFTQLASPLGWRWGSLLLVGAPLAAFDRRRPFSVSALLLWVGVGMLFLLQLNPVAHWLGVGHWTELHVYGVVTAYWVLLFLACL